MDTEKDLQNINTLNVLAFTLLKQLITQSPISEKNYELICQSMCVKKNGLIQDEEWDLCLTNLTELSNDNLKTSSKNYYELFKHLKKFKEEFHTFFCNSKQSTRNNETIKKLIYYLIIEMELWRYYSWLNTKTLTNLSCIIMCK